MKGTCRFIQGDLHPLDAKLMLIHWCSAIIPSAVGETCKPDHHVQPRSQQSRGFPMLKHSPLLDMIVRGGILNGRNSEGKEFLVCQSYPMLYLPIVQRW